MDTAELKAVDPVQLAEPVDFRLAHGDDSFQFSGVHCLPPRRRVRPQCVQRGNDAAVLAACVAARCAGRSQRVHHLPRQAQRFFPSGALQRHGLPYALLGQRGERQRLARAIAHASALVAPRPVAGVVQARYGWQPPN